MPRNFANGVLALGIFSALISAHADAASTDSQQGITVIATELRAAPAPTASVSQKLPAQTKVTLGERKGAWYRADALGKNGWLRLLSVRLQNTALASGSSGLGALANATRNTQSTTGTGIRGLTEEQLQKAQENLPALAAMEKLSVSEAEARDYASKGSISAPAKKE